MRRWDRLELGQWTAYSAAVAAATDSSDMGSQMVLPRTLLLLLFLNLLPLGGHSHPLSTSQELELSEIQVSTEGLHRLACLKGN